METSTEPSVVRKYRPIVELGRGGMAEVFLAVAQGHAGFNKLVVLKKTKAELSQDPDFITMFLDEARLAARLNHPNVVQTYEVGEEGDHHFIAMEYLEGQPLHAVRLRSDKAASFPVALHLRVLAEVLAGLHHAHELTDFDGTALDIVHRDVTPQNIFITYDGHVKIVDFGIAKAAGASLETQHGTIKGKIAYMPPEQATARTVDRRADLFAVGVMLWEAITGVRMWKGLSEVAVISRVAKGDIPRLIDAKADVAPELDRIVTRALAPRPADRYATAAEMQIDLENYLDVLGERSGPREIGRYMSERFREQRARVKQIIEDQLSDVRWSGPVSSVRGKPLPRLSSLPDSTTDSSRSGAAIDVAPALSDEGSALGRTPTGTPTGTPTAADPIAEGEPSAPQAVTPSAAVRPPRVRLALGGGAILGLLVIGAFKLLSRSPAADGGLPLAAGTASAASPATSTSAVRPAASASAAPAGRTSCPDGMALIPGGRFFMGSNEPGFDLWKPAHRVTIDTFCIDLNEVTAADYKACSDTGNCRRPDPIPNYPKTPGVSDQAHEKGRAAYAELCNFGKEDRAKHPINCVTWELADDYCRFRTGRLPTEAEWEYAARGSDGRKYPWGDDPGDKLTMNACGTECNEWEQKHGLALSQRMYDADDGYPGTAPVGSFAKGKTTFGAYDFIGNVWEWTHDWFETYKPEDAVNPAGARAGNRKAIRGGGFNGGEELWLNPAFRYHQLATASAPSIGFRCAMNL